MSETKHYPKLLPSGGTAAESGPGAAVKGDTRQADERADRGEAGAGGGEEDEHGGEQGTHHTREGARRVEEGTRRPSAWSTGHAARGFHPALLQWAESARSTPSGYRHIAALSMDQPDWSDGSPVEVSMDDSDGWSVLVNAGVGLISAGVGGLATYLWQHRRTSDRDFFLILRQAIDRPAFKGPFMWQSDQVAFRQAISTVLKTVNTGRLFDRRGEEIAAVEGRFRGPFVIRKASRRKALEEVQDRLQRILGTSQNAAGVGSPEGQEPSIDADRDQIIQTLNSVWRELNIAEMRLPTSVKLYEETRDPNA